MTIVTPKENFPKERDEHPFAPFVRILGKGKKGSRSLTEEEATTAMGMILDGQALDLQIGAFLMLLRVKEESPEELAGFVKASQARFEAPSIQVDIDWSSYAGKKRHHPWFIFSLVLLAQYGLRVFVHGAEGHTQGRVYTRAVLEELGLPISRSWSEASVQLDSNSLSYMPLEAFSPILADIIQMRSILGLRSPVHSLARLLNPLQAPLVMQGIFHPPYSQIHQQAGKLLDYEKLMVVKGEGGEIERNPDTQAEVRLVRAGDATDEVWPPLFERRHVKPENLSIDTMREVWRGTANEAEYAEAAILSTAALALRYHHDIPQAEAQSLAQNLWQKRERERF